jgi:hypothetical protein
MTPLSGRLKVKRENPNVLMKEKIDERGLYSLVILRRVKASVYTKFETENFQYGAIRQTADYKIPFDFKIHMEEYKLITKYVI